MGYFKTTVTSISWAAAERWLIRGMTFVRVVILARILIPAQIGVFGIATLTLGLLEVFTETAINYFLVQEKGSIDDYIDTAWVISILRGLLIAAVLFISTPFVSAFYHSSDSLPILYLISLAPLIRGFINPSIAKLQKDLLFRKDFHVRSFLYLVDSLTSVLLAYILRSPAGLVYGMLTSAVFEVLLSFWLFHPRPKFTYLPEKAKEIIHRGKWITAAGVFSYLYLNGDNMVVGRMLGETSLGYYNYAYNISGTPVSEISDVVSRVSFPVYVQINHDPVRLKKAFVKTTLLVCSVSSLIGIGLFIFAQPLVLIVLGAKWAPAIPALRVLSLGGIAKSITSSVYPLLLAVKRNDYVTGVTLVSILGMGLCIYPLVQMFGIVGAGVASIIGAFSSLPLSWYYVNKILSVKK
jgi:O-antigen/teichoic acid export membrane protein